MRNLTNCQQDIKAQCYKTLVRPILEYDTSVWDQCNLTLPTIEHRRQQPKLAMLKITHVLVDIPKASQLQPSATATKTQGIENQEDVVRYRPPYCRTNLCCHSFPSGIWLWSQLPEHLTTPQSLEAFKRGLASLHIRDSSLH